ncbi:hypothetical protein [Peribacillus acanthi]|uniref:hypothetical protein n=1 Tax=Peribacillus acanthi TaxID=2171554 RepID=UPI000D3EE249|nr:hypothetical protein [Peribacillus acanthi]
MNSFQIYNDLLLDIEILQEQIEMADKERMQWYIGGRLFNTVPMDNAIARFDKLSDKIEKMQETLLIKIAARNRIVEQLEQYAGLEYKVFYMRFVQCKSLKEIAEELQYSYDYIKEVSSRIGKTTHHEPTDILIKA